jgi:hypothetical protein
MTRMVSLRCRCGAVRGSAADISPAADSRSVCYCDDCQVYALHLGAPGILDERGGTDVCMLAPAQVRIEQGSEQLRCLRLSPKGQHRFYAGCCNTPIATSMSARIPIVFVAHSFMDHAAGGRTRDEDLGPPRMRIMGRFAKGGVPRGVHPKIPYGKALPSLLAHFARTVVRRLAKPSPFWKADGQPRVEPTLIDRSEREALRARVFAAAHLRA